MLRKKKRQRGIVEEEHVEDQREEPDEEDRDGPGDGAGDDDSEAPVMGPVHVKRRGSGKLGRAEREEAAVAEALGAEKGLDNTGLRIPKKDKGPYVEGQKHEGHVHLFANVPDQIGKSVTEGGGRAR